MSKVTTCTLACLVLLGPMSSKDAHATIVRAYSLSAMTVASQSIVRGTVIDQEVVYDSRWGRVYTHSIIEVSEVLWGAQELGEVVVLRQIGGELDGVESRVVGTAGIEMGDEVVLFARTDGQRHYLVGMAQGLYQVDRSGPVPRVARGIHGLAFMPQLGPVRRVAPARMPLSNLSARILATLTAAGRTP